MQPQNTPFWNQYLALRQSTQANVLLVHLGEFYEAFNDDAQKVHETTGAKMFSRQINSNKDLATMSGTPERNLAVLIAQLNKGGYSVAVAEPIGNEPINGLLPREVKATYKPKGKSKASLRVQQITANPAIVLYASKHKIDETAKEYFVKFEGGEYSLYTFENKLGGAVRSLSIKPTLTFRHTFGDTISLEAEMREIKPLGGWQLLDTSVDSSFDKFNEAIQAAFEQSEAEEKAEIKTDVLEYLNNTGQYTRNDYQVYTALNQAHGYGEDAVYAAIDELLTEGKIFRTESNSTFGIAGQSYPVAGDLFTVVAVQDIPVGVTYVLTDPDGNDAPEYFSFIQEHIEAILATPPTRTPDEESALRELEKARTSLSHAYLYLPAVSASVQAITEALLATQRAIELVGGE